LGASSRSQQSSQLIINQETIGKPGTVCKDVLTYFYLEMTTWTLGTLCKKKVLSILSNRSTIKDISSHSNI